MKTMTLLSAALIIASCALYLSTPAPGAASGQASEDSSQIGAALNARLDDAYRQKDWAKLEELVAPDYLGITEDFEWSFADLKREFPKIRLTGSKIERQIVKRLTPDLILVNEVFWMQETFDGADISGRYSTSNIWVRRGERWLLLVEQEVRVHDAAK